MIFSQSIAHTRHRRIRVIGLALGIVLAAVSVACGSGDSTPVPTSTTVPAVVSTPTSEAPAIPPTPITRTGLPYGITGPEAPPPVDIFDGIVPPEDIVFDTFDGSSVRLPDAPRATINRLFNAIRPVYVPTYEGASSGAWLSDGDFVLGYEGETQAYAYPVKFLNFHEIVNDEIDGIPVLITYCPLCGSGVVFDRRLDGETHVFGNTSALYQNDLVMIDHETGSYWFQTGGEAVIGPLSGTRLDLLPSMMMPWSDWLSLHPDTLVLSRDQGFGTPLSRYDRDPFGTYAQRVDAGQFAFPVDEDRISGSLRLAEIVLTVRVNETEKAYPIGRIGDNAANDEIDGTAVAVFAQLNGPSATAHSPLVNGTTLTFTSAGDGLYTDDQTNSTWDFTGRAISGELSGERLAPLPSRRAMWFSISIDQPEIEIYFP